MIDLTNAIDIDAIESAFIELIQTALGITTIKAEQSDAVFPSVQQVATVHFLASQQTGLPSRSYAADGNNLTETVTSVKRGTMSVNFYRETDGNAIQFADVFHDYLWTTEAKAVFRRANIGIILSSPTRNLSEVEKGRWESRAQLDVEVYAINQIATTVETIDTVGVTGSFEDGSETYPINISVETP